MVHLIIGQESGGEIHISVDSDDESIMDWAVSYGSEAFPNDDAELKPCGGVDCAWFKGNWYKVWRRGDSDWTAPVGGS